MNWLDTITYILYGCGVLIILLFAVNLILAKKRGEDSKWVRRALYVVAFIAAVLGAIRAKAVYSETVFFAEMTKRREKSLAKTQKTKAAEPQK